jgi:hypothetical protein
MFGRQTADGTNVSRYEWCPDDDACATQAEVAAADPRNYGTARPMLAKLHRHWETQRALHHAAQKRAPDADRDDDPAAVLKRLDARTIV